MMKSGLSERYDNFLEGVLRRARPEFGFIAPDYASNLPAELTWVLVSALISSHRVSVRSAGRIVLDFCERRGQEIPALLNSVEPHGSTDMQVRWQ